MSSWSVYCLQTINPPFSTYIGATVDPDRRLAQHNGLLVGGAKATKKVPGEWQRVCLVQGFRTSHEALSFEWHWKHFSRRGAGREKGLERCLLWATQKFPGLVLEVEG
jgi:predicted GIY-YIG superfamily endonuclease